MAEVTTALKVTATADNTVQKSFRDVAAQVEAMSARVTRSQRTMVAEHKAAANVFVQSAQMVQTSIGKISGAFGVGLGIGALVEAGKKAVTVFATVDEQARALAVSTKRTEEEIAGFYERVKQVAGAAAIDADKLRDSFDDLARAIGPEAAAAALPRLAMAAKAMKAPIADVVGLTEQMNDNLGISADQAPAAFDMIQKGTEGTRTTAAGATKGLADLSLQMRGLGEGGEKGLRSTLGMLVAIGKHAPSTEAAVASLQSLMDKVGTRKTDESLEKLGRVPMRAALDEAKRKHQDEFLVFLNEVDKALTNMATEAGTPIASKMQYLQRLIKSPEDRQAVQSILEGKAEWRAIRDRTPAQEAGATDKAFETMRPGAASFLTKLGNAWNEAFEGGGRNIWERLSGQHQSTEAEKLPAGRSFLPPTMRGSPGTTNSWWDWLNQFNPISGAHAAEAPGGGFPAIQDARPLVPSAAEAPRGGSPALQGARPLIPSEPGSATERTAREQLEAIRRLERASLWGGGLGAPGGVASPGGNAPSGAPAPLGGGGRRPSRPGIPGTSATPPLSGGGGRRPSGPGGGASLGSQGWWTPERQKYAYDKLRAGGLSDAGARGLVSRWVNVESARGPSDQNAIGGGHFGIAQWSHSRAGGLWGNTDFDAQLDHVLEELRSTESGAGKLLKEAQTDEEGARAATAYERAEHYEKAGHGPHEDDWTAKTQKGMPRVGEAIAGKPSTATAGQGVIQGQGDPHKPGFDPNAVKFHDFHPESGPLSSGRPLGSPMIPGFGLHTELEEFRREAAEPVRVKVKYDYEDTRGIRDRGEAQGRRVFNRETKRSRYLSFSDVGVV